MPKTGGIASYNLLHDLSGETNKPMQFHTVLDMVEGSEDLPIVIGSRNIDTWHRSYYNYVFKQMAQYPYHIHELFKETPTFEKFLEFSYHKTCDFGEDENNPNNAYGGFPFVTTLHKDWWKYEGNLYDYMREHILCNQTPDHTIRQEHFIDDWMCVYEELNMMTDTIAEKIRKSEHFNVGAFQ